MKKVWIITLVIATLVLIAGIIYYIKYTNSDHYYQDDSLLNMYPDLANYSYMNKTPETSFSNGILFVNGNNNLSLNFYNGTTFCNGNYRKPILYLRVSSNKVGGSGSTYVIDCDTYYYVEDIYDTPAQIYGPFVPVPPMLYK